MILRGFVRKIGSCVIFLMCIFLPLFCCIETGAAAGTQVTNIRWSMMPDTDSARILRVVLDLSGPYEVSKAVYSQTAKNQILISGSFRNLALAPNAPKTCKLSDDIARSVDLQTDGDNLKLMVNLPNHSESSSLNVFVLREDKKNNKPWRIVIDIIKPLPASMLTSVLPATKLTAADYGVVQVTDLRWSLLPDVNGSKKLRVVLDLSGPYRLEDGLKQANQQLQAILTNIRLGNRKTRQIKVGDTVAKSFALEQVDDSKVKLTVQLPGKTPDDCYNLFVLREDRANNKPWRLVMDIAKPVPIANLKFSAGLRGKRICIDPGHGGSDPGAIGPGGTHESDVTLPICLQLKTILENAGSTVFISRADDRDVFAVNADDADELQARADVANANKADVFVCVHADSFRDPNIGGTGTYYYPKTNFDGLLAFSVQSSLISQIGLENRGVNRANFYVLKNTRTPAILVEVAFISNPAEEKKLADNEFQGKVARGIALGLDKFFSDAAALNSGR